MGKGSKIRPPQISYEEEHLRWLLFQRVITFKVFQRRYNKLKVDDKIYRRPRYKLNKGTTK